MAYVPVTSSLGSIYDADELPAQTARWAAVQAQFRALYGRAPTVMARSPGRVNLLGEHIDYSLYAVVPMAVAADALVALYAAPGSGAVRIANTDSERFPPVVLAAPLPCRNGAWTDYFCAGHAGALDFARRVDTALAPLDICVLVDGSVPVCAGLSSSSALVTASALAVLAAHGIDSILQHTLVDLAVVAERAVGVNSGGMDQAASVLARRGSVLMVAFWPTLAVRPVRLPQGLRVVIAQSLVAAAKQADAPERYNLRVAECALAAAVLQAQENRSGLPIDASPLGASLRGFHEAHFTTGEARASEEAELAALVELVTTRLTESDGFTCKQVADLLGISEHDVTERFMGQYPVRAERFKLRQRAHHVFSEALRVCHFVNALDRGDDDEMAAQLGAQLGVLMDQSHASCRDLFECSCAELDELCVIARRAGALGSRLTGAGWGGCSVHLVPADDVDQVRAAWERDYYQPRGCTPDEMRRAVVVSTPAGGSALFRPPKDGGGAKRSTE